MLKPSPKPRARDGGKVVRVVAGRKKSRPATSPGSLFEAEDAALVAACRPSINEAMRAEER